MDSSYSEDFYLSLVEVIQGLCSKFIKFQHFVEVSGYISVEIDNVRKEKYVISELVKTSGNISHSYCSHVHIDPKGRIPGGYSSSCTFQMAKLPQESDDRNICPIPKVAGQKGFPVSFVRPLSTLNSNVSGQPTKAVKQYVLSNCASGESKPTQHSSSLNQSSSKPQPLSTSRVQYSSSQNHLMRAQKIDGYIVLPPVSTRTQPVIVIDDNDLDIKHASLRQAQKDSAVGNPVPTGGRLMSVPSSVTRPLPSHPRSAPVSRGQAVPSSSQSPNVSGHPQEISCQKRRHTIEPVTTESPLMTASIQGPLVSNKQAATKRAESDHSHIQSRRSMPIQLAREGVPVRKLRRCSDSLMRPTGIGVSTQGQPLHTSLSQQQKAPGPTVITMEQPPHQQVSRRPLKIPRPKPVASHRNSTPGLVNVDLQSTCRLPVVQLEPLFLPNHLDEMHVDFHVAEGTCNKSGPKPNSTQIYPMNDVDFMTENMDQGLVVQNTHQNQNLQFSPEFEKANLVEMGMPDISSEEAVLATSKECEQLTDDMPLLLPQPRSVQPSKPLSKSASEEDTRLFENSDDDDCEFIDAELEEEIYLMQVKEEREKEERMKEEVIHSAEDEAVKSAPSSTVPSAVEKETPGSRTWSLRTFTKYHMEKSGKEMVDLFSVSPRKLNAMLIEFFKGATRADGRSLSPSTLRYVQLDLQRILNSGGYQYSLLKDADFQSSRYFLNTLLKGKNNSDPAARIVNKEEVNILFKEKVLGGHNLISLRNSMWFMTSKYFGLKNRMHVKLKWGDILLKTDKFGKEFLVGPTQGNKTPKAFADAEEGDCCFVHLYKMYRRYRPESTLDLESPFYLKMDKKCNQYSTETISSRSISAIWNMMLAKASLTPGLKVS